MFAQIWLKSVCGHFEVVENRLCGILFVKKSNTVSYFRQKTDHGIEFILCF